MSVLAFHFRCVRIVLSHVSFSTTSLRMHARRGVTHIANNSFINITKSSMPSIKRGQHVSRRSNFIQIVSLNIQLVAPFLTKILFLVRVNKFAFIV